MKSKKCPFSAADTTKVTELGDNLYYVEEVSPGVFRSTGVECPSGSGSDDWFIAS